MKSVIEKKTYVPRFMSCSDFNEPHLKYIYHSHTPRMLIEVADYADSTEKEYLKENKLLFKEVL